MPNMQRVHKQTGERTYHSYLMGLGTLNSDVRLSWWAGEQNSPDKICFNKDKGW